MKALLLLSALLSSSAFANTICGSADARVEYRSIGYNRGIPPRDGDELGSIEVRVDGKLVSRSVAYQGRSPDLGPINPDISEIQILRKDGMTKDFSAKLALTKNATNPSAVRVELPLETYVICRTVDIAVP